MFTARVKAIGLFGCLLLGTVSFPAVAGQSGQGSTVFRIGIFDRSSGEFAQGSPFGALGQGVPVSAVNFVVGKSSAAKDWYANQPVSAPNGPWTITFSLDHAPAASYMLHVALLIESPALPALQVGIDGKRGRFYLHPVLDYAAGDQTDAFNPAYSHADVVFDFPGSYLRQGENTITLAAVEEGAVLDALLTYDAIELSVTHGAAPPQSPTAKIVPTIFYQKQAGGLEELVDVYLPDQRGVKPEGPVDLTIGSKPHHQQVSGDEDFGEAKVEFAVPEFAPHARALLEWQSGSRRRKSQEFLDPAKKWKLFLVPHIHLDAGYSDYQAKIAAIQGRVIGEAMDFTDRHPDFRFSVDGSWDLEQFLKTRTPTEQTRAIHAIQKEQLFIPAQYANLLTGFPTAETLIRSLYASANFSRVYGTPFNYANITDVPSYTWSYASILASAGIHDFLAGSDNYRAPVLLQGHLNEESPMWWEGPDGQKVLFWYSRHYMQMQFLFGLPPKLSAGRDMLPLFLRMYEQPGYRADATIIFGSQAENTDLFPQQAEVAQKWNSLYAYPQLQYSGFHDALEKIAAQFGNDLPTLRGDGGPYWEDGIASDAYYAAMERENENRGVTAEKLSTLTSLVNPRLAASKPQLDTMWKDMVLMDEHTWTSWNSVSDPKSQEATKQLAIKDRYAINARALADWLTRNSMASIADSISIGKGGLIVFNSLNWKHNGLVSLDLDDGQEITDPATGQTVPVEILWKGNQFQHVTFVARDVPALGYKVYQIRPAEKPEAAPEAARNTTLENSYYRIQLDPASGAIESIYDKQLQRELVDRKSPYRFGQYLYVTGGDHAPNRLLQYSSVAPIPDLAVHPAHGGSLVSVQRTPYGWEARMKSMDTNTPEIATAIWLFDGEKKLELVEDVDKEAVLSKEGVYFAFPFAIDRPEFQYEIQNGIVDPAKDLYAGAGHVWFSVQHWAAVQGGGFSAAVMPLDASLVTFGDINRGDWPERFQPKGATIFSYVMNNYWNTNYRAEQGGHCRFRYVITSAPSTDATRLSRTGWEEMTPLEVDKVTSQDKAINPPRPLRGKQGSFLNVQDPDVVLSAWKPAEDGKGTILRFIDFAGTSRDVTVETPLLQIEEAWQTDAVERNGKQLSLDGAGGFHFTIHPHEIVTIRLVGKDVPPAPTDE